MAPHADGQVSQGVRRGQGNRVNSSLINFDTKIRSQMDFWNVGQASRMVSNDSQTWVGRARFIQEIQKDTVCELSFKMQNLNYSIYFNNELRLAPRLLGFTRSWTDSRSPIRS